MEKKSNFSKKYDVVVIGGGPAGMMAAGTAAELGAHVLLLEKNESLGKKLLLTGGGRCNLTHAEFDVKKFVGSLGKRGRFLFSALSAFGVQETIGFFAMLGLETKIEKNGKVFPVSDKAEDVLQALERYLKNNKVEVMTGSDVLGFELDDAKKKIVSVRLKNGIIQADKFILSTGGASYPATGSTGDGYAFARECGHEIVNLKSVLVPLKTREEWVKEAQGVSLQDVTCCLLEGERKVAKESGDMIFTHFGISGPAILNLSRELADFEKNGKPISISIDLRPESNKEELDAFLQKDFMENINKDIVNYLAKMFPLKLAKVILRLAEIPQEKKMNIVTKEERHRLRDLLKDLRLAVSGDLGLSFAMVTRGGVDLPEVDPKAMRSKLVSNLYLSGEVLDLDGPTGGYNLQIAWSTGRAAGESAARKF